MKSGPRPAHPGPRRVRHRVSAAFHAHKATFSRATLTAAAATVIDFSTLYSLVEFAHVYYVIATACGALAGAVANFSLNRTWAFDARHHKLGAQSARYVAVSGGSLLLNTGLVFCFTEFGGLRYLVSKVVAALLVGWCWNYPLHNYYVFAAAGKKSNA